MASAVSDILDIIATGLSVYDHHSKKFKHFKKKGIPQLKSHFHYGNSKELVTKKKSQGEVFREFYEQFKAMEAPHGGIYILTNKVWVPVEPELIKTILTQDITHFSDHINKIPGLHLKVNFHMAEKECKEMKEKLIPILTSGKLDSIYNVILEKSHGLVNILREFSTGESIEIHEILKRNYIGGTSDQNLEIFSAISEASSTTISYAMLEMSHNKQVQQKLRQEVQEVLKRYKGKLTNEAVNELTYCDNVVHETLRKYPLLPFVLRQCKEQYLIPHSSIHLNKGTAICVPIWGLHMDPDHFPEPERFLPERFSIKNKHRIKEFTYLPFGEGPQICLGSKLTIMQCKAALAILVNNYKFTPNSKTWYPVHYQKSCFALLPENGIWLNIVKV